MAKFNVQKDTARKIQFVLTDDESNRYDLVDADSVTFIVTKVNPQAIDEIKIEKLMSIVDRNLGLVEVSLLDTDTALAVDTYEYSISIKFGTDDNRIATQGLFVIDADDVTSRIEQIKKKFGLNFEMYILEDNYRIARNSVKNNVLEKVKYDVKSKLSEIPCDTTVIDLNDDNVIDESDFNVYQYLTASPYTVEDLNSHITSISVDSPIKGIITLDATFPDDGYILRVEYYNGRRTQSASKELIERVEEKYLLLLLFENLEPYKLQHGMSTKDINGLNVTFDQVAIENMRKSLKNQIVGLKLKLAPLEKSAYNNAGTGGLAQSITLSKLYDTNKTQNDRINSYSASLL